jgi:RNase H-like protein
LPRALRQCEQCRETFRPRPERGEAQGSICAECREKERYFGNVAKEDRPLSGTVTFFDAATGTETPIGIELPGEPILIPPPRRACPCGKDFVPPMGAPETDRCSECRRLVQRPRGHNPYKDGREKISTLTPPLRIGVFDLETWGLDRGWGVTLVGSMLIHDGTAPSVQTFLLRDTAPYQAGRRSDDSALGKTVLEKLYDCDILIAHNGARFDVPWLNSVALKFGMPRFVSKKLIDPVQIARKRYRIGGNSLSSLADFLGLEEEKMPVPREVWRRALLDDDLASWRVLAERCESDVRLLNSVAARVVPDAGLIDYSGSAPR